MLYFFFWQPLLRAYHFFFLITFFYKKYYNFFSYMVHNQLCSSLDKVTAHGDTFVFTTNAHSPDMVEYLEDDYNFESTIRYLTLEEQLRVKSSKSKIKALITNLFTKLVLNYFICNRGKELLFNPWQQLPLKHNSYGKPILDRIFFNSSSSNDIITVAVSLVTEIGVDLSHAVQVSISPEDFMDQFKGIFHPDDLLTLDSIKDMHRRYIIFNQLWTLKESFTKLIGSGLNIDLQQVGFYFNDDLQVKTSIPAHDSMFQPYDVDWSADSKVTVEKELQNHQLVDMTKGPFRAVSGCLLQGNDLPVLISVMTQKNVEIQCINVNSLEILKFLQS